MYDFLEKRWGQRVASNIVAVIYFLLILAVIYCSLEPETRLNYLAL